MVEVQIQQEKPWTPFGVSKTLLVALYFIAIASTGLVPAASDPIQEMMKLNGAFIDITNEQKRASAVSKVVGFGLDCAVLSGVVVGPLVDILGMKISALIGLVLHILGYLLVFFLKNELLYYAGAALFGIAFQLLLNSHLSVGCLFPKSSSIVLTLISAAPDLSLFIPAYMFDRAKSMGGTPAAVQSLIGKYLIICAIVGGVVDAILLPTKPFEAAKTSDDADASLENGGPSEDTPILESAGGSDELVHAGGGEDENSLVDAGGDDPMKIHWGKAVSRQLVTPEFLLFLPYFIFAFMRKKHYSSSLRPTLLGIEGPDGDGSKTDAMMKLFNSVAPYGFIPAVAWGAAVSYAGIVPSFFASNVLGVAFTTLALFPSLNLQYLTMLLFLVHQSFVFGLCLSFCATFFGFATLPTLQGIACAAAGTISMGVFAFWNDFITDTLQSYRSASLIITAIGAAMFVCHFGVAIVVAARKRTIANRKKQRA